VPVQLGVIDREGRPVERRAVTAKLKLIDWTYSRKPRKGGGYDYQWQRTVKDVGQLHRDERARRRSAAT
jgi:hypothetical protein